jgi:hypothetical protein
MPDNKPIIYPLDKKRIDINDLAANRRWCKSLKCTPQELTDAVKKVGTSGAAIRKYIGK